MPRVQLLSDIHFEFHQDGGQAFVDTLDPEGVDVLALAGDIGTLRGSSLHRGLKLIAEKYTDTPIILVRGNHEYYSTSRELLDKHLEAICQDIPTLTVLENDTVTIKGQRFVGCTLWFPNGPDNRRYDKFLTDFRVIEGFRDWNYDACNKSMEFLAKTVQEGDFVITHHIPDYRGVHPKYRKGPAAQYNRYFLCQMPQWVLERADWWVFGHTHESMAFEIGNCKFRCNPLAYPHEGNPHFNPKLILGGTETVTCEVCEEVSEWASDHAWLHGPQVQCPHCFCDLTLEAL